MDTITIKVDPSGKGDFTTINDALDSVEAVNDNIPVRIELAPGEYYERLEIIRPHVTLVGEDPDTPCITHRLYALRLMEVPSAVPSEATVSLSMPTISQRKI